MASPYLTGILSLLDRNDLTVDDLKHIARTNVIKGYSYPKNKAELINFIKTDGMKQLESEGRSFQTPFDI